jgi:hypothetical protein
MTAPESASELLRGGEAGTDCILTAEIAHSRPIATSERFQDNHRFDAFTPFLTPPNLPKKTPELRG